MRAATALGYDCVDREILKAVAERHDVPETDLHKALEESPSPFGISSKNHARYQGIVAKHGGRILVSSVQGKGSTFTVILPVTTIPADISSVNNLPGRPA